MIHYGHIRIFCTCTRFAHSRPPETGVLRRYLGMVNYYHRFIPHCAAKLMPLNTLLTEANEGHKRLSPKSNFDVNWNESADSAFIGSKQMLDNATLLVVHLDPSAPLNITCDASDFAVRGVLQQCVDNIWHPLSFFSKKLSPAALLTVNCWQFMPRSDTLDII